MPSFAKFTRTLNYVWNDFFKQIMRKSNMIDNFNATEHT